MPEASTIKHKKGKSMKEQPVIPNPGSGLYGVSIHSDGSIENIGIGVIEADKADAVADRLEQLASAIRKAATRRF